MNNRTNILCTSRTPQCTTYHLYLLFSRNSWGVVSPLVRPVNDSSFASWLPLENLSSLMVTFSSSNMIYLRVDSLHSILQVTTMILPASLANLVGCLCPAAMQEMRLSGTVMMMTLSKNLFISHLMIIRRNSQHNKYQTLKSTRIVWLSHITNRIRKKPCLSNN